VLHRRSNTRRSTINRVKARCQRLGQAGEWPVRGQADANDQKVTEGLGVMKEGKRGGQRRGASWGNLRSFIFLGGNHRGNRGVSGLTKEK